MMDESTDSSALLTRLNLDLRGTRFSIERETLMNLPESVLLCLFPNGLVLSRNHGHSGATGEDGEPEDDDDEVYMVDFDPKCLSYVLTFFKQAQDDFYGLPGNPSRRAILASHHAQQSSADYGAMDAFGGVGGAGPQNPLLNKQAIIVLREELEYFCIPPKGKGKGAAAAAAVGAEATPAPGAAGEATDENGVANEALLQLKQACGAALLERKHIFTALQRNVNKENNMAEQHLIDMLCMSGFDRDDSWGFRALEPSRCCITSIALVLLKTGISAEPANGAAEDANAPIEESDLQIDQQQLATAQKLLLFWRKPARKCWWDGAEVVLELPPGASPSPADSAVDPSAGMTQAEADLLRSGKGRKVTVWARRVWTLELSLL